MARIAAILSVCLLITGAVCAETLFDAWQISVQVNHRLQAEAHQVRASQAELQTAKANRLPTVSNSTSYYTLSHPMSGSIGFGMPPTKINLPLTDQSFASSMTLAVVPIYAGGKIRAGIDASKYEIRAAQAGYAVSQQEIRWQVTEAYLNVLRTRRILDVAQTSEYTVRQHLADVNKLLQQKMVTRNALLSAQTALAAAAQDVLKTENAVALTEAAYNRFLGRPLDTPVAIEDVSVQPLSGELVILTDTAFRFRKELNQIQAKSQAALAQGRISQADKLPHVVALGGHAYSQNSYLNDEDAWLGAVSLRWTPFDGGAAQGRERAAKENAAAAAKQHEEVQTLIELQVHSAWLTERETRKRVHVAELGLQQATENLRVVTRQFQEGLVNHTEVLDAQSLRTSAETNLCNAVYDAVLATYQVLYAVGNL
ncbi:hypothetical protein FACS1894170_08930 [Planctomycetales bacterium]|nr:hypothetical protein FACS1894170_08930 [Planctomycetales bacterium]